MRDGRLDYNDEIELENERSQNNGLINFTIPVFYSFIFLFQISPALAIAVPSPECVEHYRIGSIFISNTADFKSSTSRKSES